MAEPESTNGDEELSTKVWVCCPAHLVLIATVPTSPDIPRVVHLKKSEASIGRDRAAVDMFLDSQRFPRMISRVHAHIAHLSNDQWKLRDNRSVNGIYVNSIKVGEAILNDGDVITFGGGGNAAFGSTKEQPEAEFIYKFSLNHIHSARGKSPSAMLDDSNVVESAPKRRKTAELDEEGDDEDTRKLLAEKDKEVQALRQLLANKDKIQAEVEENKANEIEDQKHAIALAAVLADKEQLRAELLAKESTMQELAQKLAESEAAGKVLQEMLDQQATERAEERATLKELKEQLKMHREQSETKIDKSAVEEELTCSICQELLCDAQTLDCSHSFCAECLAQWRKHKQECPFCRAKITKSPIKSITLDGVIRKLVQNFAEDDKKAWSDRLAQRKDDPYNKLLEMITAAKQKKMKFLDIGTRWSANEQGTFFDGVSRYEGKARVLYMSTTGLTADWIRTAGKPALVNACLNLKLCSIGNPNQLRHRVTGFLVPIANHQVINV